MKLVLQMIWQAPESSKPHRIHILFHYETRIERQIDSTDKQNRNRILNRHKKIIKAPSFYHTCLQDFLRTKLKIAREVLPQDPPYQV